VPKVCNEKSSSSKKLEEGGRGNGDVIREMSTKGVATVVDEKDREKIDEIPETEWKQRVNVSHKW
jgi:hypothetical protein